MMNICAKCGKEVVLTYEEVWFADPNSLILCKEHKVQRFVYCKKHSNTFFNALLSQGCEDCAKLNKELEA